jgi:plasmid stability protein
MSIDSMGNVVADLLVRGVDENIFRTFKECAEAQGQSAEAEHREILAAVLARPRKRTLPISWRLCPTSVLTLTLSA